MKTLFNAALFGLLSCSLLSTAWAQGDLRDKYFAVSGYFYDPDDTRRTDRKGAGADLTFGLQMVGPLYLEARAFGAILESGANSGADAYNGGLGADLQYVLGQRGNFAAFAIAGLGFAYNDVNAPLKDEGVFQANTGIGLLSPALTSSKIRLRLEGRYIYEDFLGGVDDYRIGAGIEIPLGPSEAVVEDMPLAPAQDLPPPVQEDYYPPRPIDTDNDGVLDNFDVCPGTLAGTKVDRAGCAVPEQNITLQGVQFEMASDRLTPNSLRILDQAAAALKGQPDMKVRVAGHTDSLGKAQYNENLSMRRARSVKQYLVSQGVAPARLSVMGYGESQPVANNETEEGRSMNRRVEFEIQSDDPK